MDGASSYRIMIARDPAFKDIVLEKRIQPDKALPILNIEDGSYYLRAESIDALGLIGIPSDTAQLNIRVNPLPPFVNSPEDGTEYKGTEVLFKWLKVSDAIRYHVQVAEDDAFETLVTDRDDVRTNEYQINVPGFGTYSFRIRSMSHDGYKGAWSDILHFTTVPPPPRPPVEAPEVGEELIKIRWGDLGEGITYHFQMAGDEGFQEILLDQRLEKPEISFEKPEKPGTYYIRTSGIDATGYEGEFSMPPQSFEVEKGFPYELLGIITGFAILIMM